MLQRKAAWSRRLHFNPASTAMSLSFGAEIWNWDPSLYESTIGLRRVAERAGRGSDDSSLMFHVTHTLIDDVIDAAGGVEGAHVRFEGYRRAAQDVYDRWAERLELPDGGGIVDPTLEDAWYSIEEMIVWARMLEDRLERSPLDRAKYHNQGLIPALADGPRRQAIEEARARAWKGGLREVRFLANLNLHQQPVMAGSKSGKVRSGIVVLPFPDRVTQGVKHRWELTYDDGRDAHSFADELMLSVERLVDDILTALETHVPERLRADRVR